MANNRDYAIIIGIEEYLAMERLNGPVNDAISFRDWLTDPEGGDLPIENCKFVEASVNPYHPIHDDIDQAYTEIIGDGTQVFRRLYFFFAGHGYGISWDTNGLCLPKWTNQWKNYALCSKSYLDYSVSCNYFEEVYFFLDCCRNRLSNVVPMTPYLSIAKNRGADVSSLVLFAADFDSPANEGADPLAASTKVQGYFSKALIMGLKGGAADPNGNITADSLMSFTSLKTSELAREAQKSQRVSQIFSAPGKVASDIIIKQNLIVNPTMLTVTFQEAGKLSVSGPTLEVLYGQELGAGETSKPIPLEKGIYAISNEATGAEKMFKIDGTSQTLHYDL